MPPSIQFQKKREKKEKESNLPFASLEELVYKIGKKLSMDLHQHIKYHELHKKVGNSNLKGKASKNSESKVIKTVYNAYFKCLNTQYPCRYCVIGQCHVKKV